MGRNYRFEQEWAQARKRRNDSAPAPSISLDRTSLTINAGGSATTFTATVTNSTASVVWALTGSGTISVNGNKATYTPPASVASDQAVTLKAAINGTTTSAQASITVTPATAVSITVSPASANLTAGDPATTFTATVKNSTAGVTWAVTGGGTLSATTGTSVNYTPPSSVSASTDVTITATVTGTTTSVPVPVTVNPPSTSTIPIVSSSLRALTSTQLETYLGPAGSDLRFWDNRVKNGLFPGTTKHQPSWPYMTSTQRDDTNTQVADALPWDTKYVASDGDVKGYWASDIHTDPDGTIYRYRKPGRSWPKMGQYHICRDMSNKGLSATGFAFRNSKDLRYLSLACMDLRHSRRIMTNTSGLGSKVGDGYWGWPYGSNGVGHILVDFARDVGTLYDNNNRSFRPSTTSVATVESRGDLKVPSRGSGNWLTYQNQWKGNKFEIGPAGSEIALEYGVVMGIMVAGLAAYQNRDQYCPINEPQGASSGRPPAYYAAAAADAKFIWEQIDEKFKLHWSGHVKDTLALNMSIGILHADISEVCGAVCYAKIDGGVAWRSHPVYKNALRALALIAGPWQRAGYVNPNGGQVTDSRVASHWMHTHPTYGECYFWAHQPPRYKPSTKKDANGNYIRDWTGEIPTSDTTQYPHETTYTRMTNAAWPFLWYEGVGQDVPWFNEEFLKRCANGCVAGLIKHGKTGILPALPKYTDGNGAYPVPTGWTRQSGTGTGADASSSAISAYMALAPWDNSGELEAYNKARYENNGGPKGHGGIGVAMACVAKRAGLNPPHTAN